MHFYKLHETNGFTYAQCFNDIRSSDNQVLMPTGYGYDYPTGLGTPIVNNLIPYLMSLA